MAPKLLLKSFTGLMPFKAVWVPTVLFEDESIIKSIYLCSMYHAPSLSYLINSIETLSLINFSKVNGGEAFQSKQHLSMS